MDLIVDEITGFVLAIGGLLLLAAPDQVDFFFFGHTITNTHLAIGILILGVMIITYRNSLF